MREHKYRGLTKEGKWVYGDLLKSGLDRYIIPDGPKFNLIHWVKDPLKDPIIVEPMANVVMEDILLEVDPATVGEFTGLLDKNGKEIYRGDKDKDGGVVIWNTDDASFLVEYKDIETQSMMDAEMWFETIGTIHDAPEEEGE